MYSKDALAATPSETSSREQQVELDKHYIFRFTATPERRVLVTQGLFLSASSSTNCGGIIACKHVTQNAKSCKLVHKVLIYVPISQSWQQVH